MRRSRPIAVVLAAFALVAMPAFTPLAAQGFPPLDEKKPIPVRPKLPAGADTNDASAYHAYGNRPDVDWRKSYDAYWWALRLNPANEAHRLALQNAVYYSRDIDWRIEYFYGAEFVVKSKEAKLLDTLQTLTALKEPFATLRVQECRVNPEVLHEPDPVIVAMHYYERGCNGQAADKLVAAIATRPRDVGLRINRARALVWSGQPVPALAELQAALDTLRARDTKRTARFYQSKEVLELMRGSIYESQQDYFNAKQAYGKALEENLAFYTAHARLARVALVQGEVNEALQEYEQAIQIYGEDGVLHDDYGEALLAAGKFEDAEKAFRRAIELEPYYATPQYNLARALDRQGKAAEASAQYEAYLARAPRRQAKTVSYASGRIAALKTASK